MFGVLVNIELQKLAGKFTDELAAKVSRAYPGKDIPRGYVFPEDYVNGSFPEGHVFPEDHLDPYTFADRMRTVAQDYKDRGGTVPAQKNTSPFASIRNAGRSVLNKLNPKTPPPVANVFDRYRDAQR